MTNVILDFHNNNNLSFTLLDVYVSSFFLLIELLMIILTFVIDLPKSLIYVFLTIQTL